MYVCRGGDTRGGIPLAGGCRPPAGTIYICESSIPRQGHLTSSIWPGQPTFHVVLHPQRLAGTLVRGRNGAKPCGVNLGRFSSVTSFITGSGAPKTGASR